MAPVTAIFAAFCYIYRIYSTANGNRRRPRDLSCRCNLWVTPIYLASVVPLEMPHSGIPKLLQIKGRQRVYPIQVTQHVIAR
jgi:hypothetical protein